VHVGTLTSGEYDSTISLELLETDGTRARNGGHLVTGASELVCEGATDLTGTNDGNRQT
jgi:hypothetical protein